jgi:hypothetical protein
VTSKELGVVSSGKVCESSVGVVEGGKQNEQATEAGGEQQLLWCQEKTKDHASRDILRPYPGPRNGKSVQSLSLIFHGDTVSSVMNAFTSTPISNRAQLGRVNSSEAYVNSGLTLSPRARAHYTRIRSQRRVRKRIPNHSPRSFPVLARTRVFRLFQSMYTVPNSNAWRRVITKLS